MFTTKSGQSAPPVYRWQPHLPSQVDARVLSRGAAEEQNEAGEDEDDEDDEDEDDEEEAAGGDSNKASEEQGEAVAGDGSLVFSGAQNERQRAVVAAFQHAWQVAGCSCSCSCSCTCTCTCSCSCSCSCS